MTEITNLLFHPLSNAIMTVLTGITALYWLVTFFTGDLLGDTDVDIDADMDVDGADVDTDGADHDNEAGAEKSGFQKALEFVNIGKVPFMVVYTTFKLIAWIFTLVSSIVFGLATWGWKSVLILIPVFFVAFLVTRYATKPLVKIYHAMGYNGEEGHELLGRIAKMRSTIAGETIGAAELVINSDVIRVHVKSKTGESIAYNAEVMIAGESADRKYYYVVPEITLNNIV